MKWLLAFACCLAAGPLSAGQGEKTTGITRVYVEPFATRDGSKKLREDVIAELRAAGSIALVSGESGADEILGGGGEIWVKGYRSLNPRSGTSTAARTPVYAGFLALELRDTKGQILWSDLVTPGAGSENVSKSLAKRIARHVTAAIATHPAPARAAPATQPTTSLKGAGATFPYPVYAKWFTNYQRENPNIEISYDSVGSEAGMQRLLAGEVDFGASDCPTVIGESAAEQERRYLLFPSVVGAVVPIVNLPGVTGEIRFTPEALAGIYLGTVKKWNAPVLTQANRRLRLPNLDIEVVHRADGSGTSYAWTDYLSMTSPVWNSQVGAGLRPKWPTGLGANGNDGVAKAVKQSAGAIGYVEFIYALENHLAFGEVRNQHGEFVEASLHSIAAAASGEIRDDMKMSLANARSAGAYPIASFTWLVVPTRIPDESKRNAMAAFLKWMLGPGQAQAAALGYQELPKELVDRERAAIGNIR